jgi:uncharacterized protein (DUF924 family)
MTKQHGGKYQALFNGYLSYAKKHQTIIQQFGRYPYRNTVIGRDSTDEELIYLNSDSADRFDQ